MKKLLTALMVIVTVDTLESKEPFLALKVKVSVPDASLLGV